MSRGNDRGRERRSNEPQLATVRRLHRDDGDGSTTTATEEWYETERLAGQITGRAPSVPANPPVPAQAEAPVILDWRHPAPIPSPTALERLRGTLADRSRRRGTPDADASEPRRGPGPRRAVLTPTSQIDPSALARHEDEPAVDEVPSAVPTGPLLGLRGDAGPAPQPATRRATLGAFTREHSHHFRLSRAVLVSAVVLGLAAVSVIGIASQTNSTIAKSRRASLNGVNSSPVAGVGTAAKRVIGALGVLEHQVRTSRARHRAVQAHQRAREKSRAPTHHVRGRRSVGRRESSPPVTAPASAPRTSSYSNPSSAPSYNPEPASPPVTSQAAPTATQSAPQPPPTTTRSAPTPAGPSGPGGTVGSNCNPKCS